MTAWYPDAIRDPGKNAGYRRGHTKNQLAVLHFTVGTNSRALIRDNGLAAFLFPKVGKPWQFCEADSITSHACEWNDEGAGLEFERLNWGEALTPDQVKYGGGCIQWLHDTFGIPLAWHGGARLPIGSGFRGFVNHGSLVHLACDQHTDGVTAGEWEALTKTTEEEDVPKGIAVKAISTAGPVYVMGVGTKAKVLKNVPEVVGALAYLGQIVDNKVHDVSQSLLDGLTEVGLSTVSGGAVPLKVSLTGTATP